MKETGQSNLQYATLGLVVVAVIISGASLALVSGISVPSDVAKTDDISELQSSVNDLSSQSSQTNSSLSDIQDTLQSIAGKIGAKAPRIVVTSASVDPEQVKVDKEATVSVTVTNTGNGKGTKEIPLLINGQEQTSQSVTLAPGASQTLTFPVSRSSEGEYSISALGVSAMLTVSGGEALETPEEITIAWTSGPEADFIESKLPEFKEKTGIEVNLRMIPRAQLVDKIMLQLLSGDLTVDGAVMHIPKLPSLAETGRLVNLYDFMSKQKMLDEGIYKSQLEALEYDENLYMLQGQWNGALLTYYRKDYYNNPEYESAYKEQYGEELEPPKNPEEMLQVAKFWDAQYKKPDDGLGPDGLYPVHLQLTTKETGAGAYMFFPGLAQYFGGGIYNSKTGEILADSEGTIEAMKYLKNLASHAQPTVLVDGTFEAQKAINQGKVITADQWSYMIPMLDNPQKNEAAGNWGVSQRFCPQFPDMLGITAFDTPKKKGVWKLIKWINFNDKIGKGLIQACPKCPNRKQTAEKDWYKDIRGSEAIIKSYGGKMELARMIDSPNANQIYSKMMRRVHQALTGDKTPEGAMNSLASDIEGIVS